MSSVSILNLPPVTALNGSEYIEVVQNGTDSRAQISQVAAYSAYTAGTGLSLSANQFSITTTGVQSGNYANANITVNSQGQITSATNGSPNVVQTVNASYAENATYGGKVVIVSGPAVTVTLPTAVGNTATLTYKLAVAGTLTISAASGQTIDGSPLISITTRYTSVTLVSDNSNWWVI